MFRKLGLCCVALAMFSLAGGHLAVLQGVAWVGMFAQYSQQTGSLVTGVERTFDGLHPCDLCRNIQAAKFRDHQNSPTAPTTANEAKIKALRTDAAPSAVERTVAEASFFRAAFLFAPNRTEPPPSPPPRGDDLAA